MLFRSVAILALAAQTLARDAEQPYRPALMKMSPRQLGLAPRDTADGYIPEQTVCNDGDTCAQACGAGYQECTSSDAAVHCYNPAAKETCCPNGSGNSCQDGYYCTHDTVGDTWCCPNGMGLAECAAKYTAKGTLVSETPTPTTTSISSTSSLAITTSSAAALTTSSGAASTSSGPDSSTLVSSSVTTTSFSPARTTSRGVTTTVSRDAGGMAVPNVGAGVLAAAGLVAALL